MMLSWTSRVVLFVLLWTSRVCMGIGRITPITRALYSSLGRNIDSWCVVARRRVGGRNVWQTNFRKSYSAFADNGRPLRKYALDTDRYCNGLIIFCCWLYYCTSTILLIPTTKQSATKEKNDESLLLRLGAIDRDISRICFLAVSLRRSIARVGTDSIQYHGHRRHQRHQHYYQKQQPAEDLCDGRPIEYARPRIHEPEERHNRKIPQRDARVDDRNIPRNLQQAQELRQR